MPARIMRAERKSFNLNLFTIVMRFRWTSAQTPLAASAVYWLYLQPALYRPTTMSWLQFKCPVCGCPEFQRVVVPKSRGAPYETEFYHCLGCSVMFLEPELFTAARTFSKAVQPRGAGAQDVKFQS